MGKYLTPEADGVFGSGKFRLFASAGIYDFIPPVSKVRITVVGAGGSGGVRCTSGGAASGGSGGGYARGVFTLDTATTYIVTVGEGGASKAGTSYPGLVGGTSSFGPLISATGGGRGNVSSTATANAAAPGTGIGGDIQSSGGTGGPGFDSGAGGGGSAGNLLGDGYDGGGSTTSPHTAGGGGGFGGSGGPNSSNGQVAGGGGGAGGAAGANGGTGGADHAFNTRPLPGPDYQGNRPTAAGADGYGGPEHQFIGEALVAEMIVDTP